MRKKLIILVALSVIAVISLTYGIVTPPKYKGPKTVEVEEKIEKDKPAEVGFVHLPRRAKKSGYAQWGKNPFSFDKRFLRQPILNGILWDSQKPLVIINDVTLGVGDKIEDNTVVDIKNDRVVLNDGIREFELKLGEEK